MRWHRGWGYRPSGTFDAACYDCVGVSQTEVTAGMDIRKEYGGRGKGEHKKSDGETEMVKRREEKLDGGVARLV